MPGTGIHLLVAHEMDPDASGAFYFGSFAPDYEQERAPKDIIHLRNEENRLAALSALRDSVDMRDDFTRGWILHLFTDLLWDESLLAQYRREYTGGDMGRDDWFYPYREELGLATSYLYRQATWMDAVMARVRAVDVCAIQTSLPAAADRLEWWQNRTCAKYSATEPGGHLGYYTLDMLNTFAVWTAAEWKSWV